MKENRVRGRIGGKCSWHTVRTLKTKMSEDLNDLNLSICCTKFYSMRDEAGPYTPIHGGRGYH